MATYCFYQISAKLAINKFKWAQNCSFGQNAQTSHLIYKWARHNNRMEKGLL